MKEFYTTPEMEIIRFAPVEKIADNGDLEIDLTRPLSGDPENNPFA